MNHTDLIKRAFHITWRYKVLWIFGILLALAGGGGGGGGNVVSFSGNRGGGGMPPVPGVDRFNANFNPGLWISLAVLCCCLLLIWVIVATILQYVARTALYRG